MNRPLRALRLLSCAVTLSIPIAAHAAGAPSTEDMARCAAIAAPGDRLACYDALSHRPADAAPGIAAATVLRAAPANPAPATSPAAPAPAAAPPAPAPPATAAPLAAAASGAAAAPAAVDALDDPKNFGLTLKQQHRADAGPKSVKARIMKISPDQPGSAVIVLDIGNTWLVSDDDGWLSKGDQVTIKRAAFKSYLLIGPTHHTYRVSRIE